MEPPLLSPTPASDTAPGAFATTHWTRVLAAQGESPEAKQALSDLCAAYYGPVVAFLRREGRDDDAARELAHGFFVRVLEKESFGSPDPRRGRFRSYLLGALKHFLVNEREKAQREKRGGNCAHEELSPDGAEYNIDRQSVVSPEAIFDREWALNVLNRAIGAVRIEWAERGSAREFDLLKPWLTGEGGEESQRELAAKLEMSHSAFRVAVHRLRQRFRQAVRAEIAQTVNEPGEVATEMRHLIEALS